MHCLVEFKEVLKLDMRINRKSGFTLIEALVAVFVFLIVAGGIMQAYFVLINSAKLSRIRIAATLLANEQLEIARNLPYTSVGVIGGIPNGVLDPERILIKDGVTFKIRTTVRNVDDDFDGTFGGSPNDDSPADYKLIEALVTCITCKSFPPVSLTTNISAKNRETTSNNGALFVNVFNALGQPVEGADIHILNSAVNPPVDLSDISGVNGSLQLLDVIPSNQSYQVNVSKAGYSSDMTYLPGAASNPNPLKPHVTVASKQATQISFSIDELSSLRVYTVTGTCTSTPNIGFGLRGSKIIGTNPDVYKYDLYHVTNSSAVKDISGLEWDTYSLSIPVTSTSTHFLAGTLPMSPVSVLPGASQEIKAIVKAKNPNGLLVSVKDNGTGLPITGAEVTLRNGGGSWSITTGRGSLIQSDWQGGAGQTNFIDNTKFFSSLNVNVNNPAGEIVLNDVLGEYESDGSLESSSFDTGSAGNFYNINWSPNDQPKNSGPDSVRFQVATNNDNSTWNYVGPDGTPETYFTSSGTALSESHNGDRYFRYKVLLHTDSSASTPNISGVSFGFTADCVPSGQVFFDGLSLGSYEVDVSKTGYNEILSEPVSVLTDWQEKILLMSVK
jgi:type II secretory pathway pseudopilin PulG